jgi:hypothetical protein
MLSSCGLWLFFVYAKEDVSFFSELSERPKIKNKVQRDNNII